MRYGRRNVLSVVYQKRQSFAPSINGLATSYTLTPTLPEGLTFDTTTGIISGTLNVMVTDAKFTVTATNTAGSTTEVITINAVVVNCDATEEYPAVAHGKYAVVKCPQYYFGYGRVQCIAGSFSELDMEHCQFRRASFFSYSVSSMTLKTGVEIATLNLLADANFPSITISPELPAGLSFTDGTISGTPTEAKAQTSYVVTGTNAVETKTTTIQITVEDFGCPALDSFPAAANGAVSSSACPEGKHGTATRRCENGAFGPIDESQCIYDAITGLQYSQSSLNVAAGDSVVINEPTYTGYVQTFSIAPSAILSISSGGAITGRMMTLGETVFTITATNGGSTVTTTITITVAGSPCTGVNGISVANGEKVYSECPASYSGQAYRLCTNGILSSINYDECVVLAPTDLHYDNEDITLLMGKELSSGFPSYTSIVTSFTVEPPFPGAIQIDPRIGTFSGHSNVVATTVHTITASNDVGSTTVVIKLTVTAPSCQAMKGFPSSAIGESVTFDCKGISGYKGTVVRTCILSSDNSTAIWSNPSDY